MKCSYWWSNKANFVIIQKIDNIEFGICKKCAGNFGESSMIKYFENEIKGDSCIYHEKRL